MKNHPQSDVRPYRMLVAVLGTIALGSATTGGLAGFLVPSNLNR